MKRTLEESTEGGVQQWIVENSPFVNHWSRLLCPEIEYKIFHTILLGHDKKHLFDVPSIIRSAGTVSKHFREVLIEVLRRETDVLLKQAQHTFDSKAHPCEMHRCYNEMQKFHHLTSISPMGYFRLRLLTDYGQEQLARDLIKSVSIKEINRILQLKPMAHSLFLLRDGDKLESLFWKYVSFKIEGKGDDLLALYYYAPEPEVSWIVIGDNDADCFYRLYPTFETYRETVVFREGTTEVNDDQSVVHFKWRDVFKDPHALGDGDNMTQYYWCLDSGYPFPHRRALIKELLDMTNPRLRYDRIAMQLTLCEKEIHDFALSKVDDVTDALVRMRELTAQLMALEKEDMIITDPFARVANYEFTYIPVHRR